MPEVQLYGNFNATVWADEFLKSIKKNPSIPTDRDCMIGWFANAIMTGYDKAKQEAEKKD
jgi:hypothetical protein